MGSAGGRFCTNRATVILQARTRDDRLHTLAVEAAAAVPYPLYLTSLVHLHYAQISGGGGPAPPTCTPRYIGRQTHFESKRP
jgi:hypothetical protein